MLAVLAKACKPKPLDLSLELGDLGFEGIDLGILRLGGADDDDVVIAMDVGDQILYRGLEGIPLRLFLELERLPVVTAEGCAANALAVRGLTNGADTSPEIVGNRKREFLTPARWKVFQ
jgi:hypothetical protein